MSVSTFLGWFAILEVLVLKSRDSRSPGLLRFSRGALGSGFPIQLPPFRGWLSGSSDRRVGLAELRRTSGLVLQSLCTLPTWPWPGLAALGYSMFGCSVALLPGASAVSFAFVMLT